MQHLPKRVTVTEVGPRDGLQIEDQWIPTEIKVELVNRLSRVGFKTIQVTSFVHPKAVPQLRDAEEVMAKIDRVPGVTYEALVPNLRGMERALAAKVDKVNLMLSVTDSHSLSNANATTAEALKNLEPVARMALDHGIGVVGGMATALGCPFEGFPPPERLFMVVDAYLAMGVREIGVADTAGMANPALVYDRLSRLRDRYPDVHFSLHLHDTRRMATANIIAALEAGVTDFDGAAGGMGGCPYAPGATGNIATEDMVHMFHEMGIETGVDLDALLDVVRWMSTWVPHPLESTLLRAGKSRDVLGRRTSGQVKKIS
ncbi:hydroxymethylglutaryl-CoA lyase [Caldinitratiruptor microaerophilus]|uniref:Hydroxymethylglutaryl-CoA lyase YngG n=1 Tax=Caldinitratiruptor microaerophilus TaxID=671077 RepID=A0AA35CI97_9FIRM|nr:hydroxymethylglutaryl-CoA lyase [Caldinitratiruptor microaerophilus]BDG59467.1 hydroxymethylglutaryl-CoA lyase YngG [Caldinitratiruptor microaerophilus]